MSEVRSNAFQPRTGLVGGIKEKGPCGQRFGSGCRPSLDSPTSQIASQSVAPDGLFSFCAGLRSSVRACMGCAEEYTAAACDSRSPLYQPEGLVCALHSVPSETGKPKVIGLYPSQVSDALISEKGAKGLNAGRSLAGWCIS